LAGRLVGDPNIRGKPEINGFRVTAVDVTSRAFEGTDAGIFAQLFVAVMQLADPIVIVCGTLAFAAVAGFSGHIRPASKSASIPFMRFATSRRKVP